jgi:branched-chain amino acid transport system ATP-binding protein
MGLAPKLLESIFKSVLDINQKGTTVLLVEQNTQIALDVASRGYVMQTGEITLAGTTKSLKKNEMVKKTYLGIV